MPPFPCFPILIDVWRDLTHCTALEINSFYREESNSVGSDEIMPADALYLFLAYLIKERPVRTFAMDSDPKGNFRRSIDRLKLNHDSSFWQPWVRVRDLSLDFSFDDRDKTCRWALDLVRRATSLEALDLFFERSLVPCMFLETLIMDSIPARLKAVSLASIRVPKEVLTPFLALSRETLKSLHLTFLTVAGSGVPNCSLLIGTLSHLLSHLNTFSFFCIGDEGVGRFWAPAFNVSRIETPSSINLGLENKLQLEWRDHAETVMMAGFSYSGPDATKALRKLVDPNAIAESA